MTKYLLEKGYEKFMSAQERMPVWIMNAGWDIERHGGSREKLSDK